MCSKCFSCFFRIVQTKKNQGKQELMQLIDQLNIKSSNTITFEQSLSNIDDNK